MASVATLTEPFDRFVDPRLDGRGLTFGNSVRLLVNGGQVFPAMLEAIAQASSQVSAIIYTFHPDGVGWRFAEAFADAARRGCKVRVAFDAAGCWSMDHKHFTRMRQAGVKVYAINPVIPRHGSQVWYPIFRDHRKILSVDDRVGFVGGLNFGDEYDGHAQDKEHWRDNAVRLEGPSALYLRRLIDRTHLNCWGNAAPLTPEENPAGGLSVWVHSPEPFDFTRIMLKTYAAVLGNARKYVWVMNAYFAPNWPLVAEMERAVRRGVDVKLILAQHTDIPVIRWVSHRWYEHLLSRGIQIYERSTSVLHAKAMVADDAVSLIGSANLDARSLYLNREAIVEIFDQPFAREVAQMFRDDLALSHPVDLHRFRKRHPIRRLKEQLAYMVSPLL